MSNSERSFILLGGKPGSGKSRLGESIAMRLPQELPITVEHFSIGERVRAIGHGATSAYSHNITLHLSNHPTDPIDDELICSVVDEFTREIAAKDLILLDGYPRYGSQVESIYELAIRNERRIEGMIMTDVDDETALTRLLKRNNTHPDRPALDPVAAIQRLEAHNATFPFAIRQLEQRNLPIEVIDTKASKQATTDHGLFVAAYMLSTHMRPQDGNW